MSFFLRLSERILRGAILVGHLIEIENAFPHFSVFSWSYTGSHLVFLEQHPGHHDRLRSQGTAHDYIPGFPHFLPLRVIN